MAEEETEATASEEETEASASEEGTDHAAHTASDGPVAFLHTEAQVADQLHGAQV